MRPAVGGNALAFPKRKSSFEEEPATQALAATGPPTAFFMASESMLDSGRTPNASADNSMFGVRSLEEEGEGSRANKDADQKDLVTTALGGKRRTTLRAPLQIAQEDSADSVGRNSSISSLGSSPPRSLARRFPNPDLISQPLTPLSFASPTLGSSVPSSPKSLSTRSLRQSEDGSFDDKNSQAIVSSDEEDEDGGPSLQASAVAPQLIMPSILMPRRRSFTENGRQLGKLKVLLAGSSGKSPLLD